MSEPVIFSRIRRLFNIFTETKKKSINDIKLVAHKKADHIRTRKISWHYLGGEYSEIVQSLIYKIIIRNN